MHVQGITLLASKFPEQDIYPFNLLIFQDTYHLAFRTPLILFAGENGSGKSTLLQGMARACGIHIWQETGRLPGSYFGSDSFRHFRQALDEWSAADPDYKSFLESR